MPLCGLPCMVIVITTDSPPRKLQLCYSWIQSNSVFKAGVGMWMRVGVGVVEDMGS